MFSLLREQFPILKDSLVYLDSAATSLTPETVLEKVNHHYRNHRSNIHRSQYPTAETATRNYELARHTVAEYFGTSLKNYHVIFTSGFTAAANLVSNLLYNQVNSITVSLENHHSNLLPWIKVSKVVNTINPGAIDNLPEFPARSLIAIQTIGNVYGELWPVGRLCRQANDQGHWVFLDMAQSAARMKHDIDTWQPAFAAFSGHKVYGPTGTGALLIRKDVAEELQVNIARSTIGGGTVRHVPFNLMGVEWESLPYVLEAGTPNISGVIGLAEALRWLSVIGLHNVEEHDRSMTDYLVKQLDKIKDLSIIGSGTKKGLVSFNIKGINPGDLAILLGTQDIAVRAGGLCAHPALQEFDGQAVRASVGIYTTTDDIDKLVVGIEQSIKGIKNEI